MIKAAIIHNRNHLSNNQYFAIDDPNINMNDALYPWYLLRQKCLESHIELATDDINSMEESKILIFDDMPTRIPAKKSGQFFYLLALESEAVLPINFDESRYPIFDKIFTWNDKLINNPKIIKINYSFRPDHNKIINCQEKKKLACLINSNKSVKYPGELYSARVDVIKWFEKYHPDELDLYGHGWDRLYETMLIAKIIRKCRIPIKNHLKIYRGTIEDKLQVMADYKFAICYENIQNDGYITEKIFDAFRAGTVPIYWGAPNVLDYIPSDTLIDRRQFKSNQELYDDLIRMSKIKYDHYLDQINKFLSSDQVEQFSADHFANTIINAIHHDLSQKEH